MAMRNAELGNAERKFMKKSLLLIVLLICFTVPAFGTQFVMLYFHIVLESPRIRME